ncbi:MAG: co-chaperone GroES [Clostridia bacterium]|nr:co-chaperone GroES [Clostridia bacterium]
MKFNPTKNRVLIKPILNEQKTESGIILPGQENNYSDFALVEAIGCDVKSVKVGDKVVYNDNGKKISDNGESYIILDEEDILATVL